MSEKELRDFLNGVTEVIVSQAIKKGKIEPKTPSPVNVRPRVDKSRDYWYLEDTGCICYERETGNDMDDFRYFSGNYFFSEQEVINSKIREKALVMQKVRDIAERIGKVTDEHWDNNDYYKSYMFYNYELKKWGYECYRQNRTPNVIYCLKGQEFLDAVLLEMTPDELELLKTI
jgi:hypothetical protein